MRHSRRFSRSWKHRVYCFLKSDESGGRMLGCCLCALAASIFFNTPVASAGGEPSIELNAPVVGRIGRAYTSQGRFSRGHTGIDFILPSGKEVRAAAAGTITFAGNVAANQSVTISHDDFWQTTYSYLSNIAVQLGDIVESGQLIAYSGEGHLSGATGIHFALRYKGLYRDPLPYLNSGVVRLAPVTDPSDSEPSRGKVTSRASGVTRVDGKSAAGSVHVDSASMMRPSCYFKEDRCKRTILDHVWHITHSTGALADAAASFAEQFLSDALSIADWGSRTANVVAGHLTQVLEDLRRAGVSVAGNAMELAARAGAMASGMMVGVDPRLASTVRNRADQLGRRAVRRASEWLDTKSQLGLELALRRHTRMLHKSRAIERFNAFRISQRDCAEEGTKPGRGGSGGAPLIILVGGFGSEMRSGELPFDIDLAAAGIRRRDVLPFSYSGYNLDPSNGVPRPRAYHASETWNGIRPAAALLANFLEATRRRFPRRPIVVIAHSQGGVVARKALLDFGRTQSPPPLADRLITIGTPHLGSRTANRIAAIRDTRLGATVIAAADADTEASATSRSIADLAENSDLMREMSARLPPGIPITSIAAAEDVVVPAPQSWLRGADNVLLQTDESAAVAHSAQLSNSKTMRAVQMAITGRIPCQSDEAWRYADAKSQLIDDATSGFGDFVTDLARIGEQL